jgi:hypothetical protein
MIREPLILIARLAVGVLALGMVVGCTVNVRTTADFDPTALGRTLQTGVSSQADVRTALGEPFAKGSALMPFHDRPRLTWTYFAERGSASMGSGKLDEHLKYLFVFFEGDRLDSYLWFDSALQ